MIERGFSVGNIRRDCVWDPGASLRLQRKSRCRIGTASARTRGGVVPRYVTISSACASPSPNFSSSSSSYSAIATYAAVAPASFRARHRSLGDTQRRLLPDTHRRHMVIVIVLRLRSDLAPRAPHTLPTRSPHASSWTPRVLPCSASSHPTQSAHPNASYTGDRRG